MTSRSCSTLFSPEMSSSGGASGTGQFPAGTSTLRNPSREISFMRSGSWLAGRTSPASPTSPRNTVLESTARPPKLQATPAPRGPAGDVDVDVLARERELPSLLQNRQEEGEAIGVESERDAARVAEARGRDQRLDLEEQRPRPLERADHDGARGVLRSLGEKQPGRG